ncbi:MAG: hypothetical protein HY473_01830 [Candidatus Sungbacteria bacterium]|uniref:Phosphoribosylformylglycinamidine cyclo-ligase n=1 Tax=Candidatus Sungiibacteriota bacterium TaxID=2750080 RepID=A0A933DUB1_9BACT|nr:hypothetical protein [Candidatus Sungbacteria bacterium]
MGRAYAAAGVDYAKIAAFKRAMVELCEHTREFPLRRRVEVSATGSLEYLDAGFIPHRWRVVSEGLGTKSWIAEWMYKETGDPRYFAGIGIDAAMMAVVDLLRYGALPVGYTDVISAGESEWFADEARRDVIRESFYEACRMAGMAMLGGESEPLRYLVKPTPPLTRAPVFSGAAIGLIAPAENEIRPDRLVPGAQILGVPSSGVHANGLSLVVEKGLTLPDKFLTPLPTGRLLGEEALIPTRSYVALVEKLLETKCEILSIVPATGGGITKIALQGKPYTYRITRWVEVPYLFEFLNHHGVPYHEGLKIFNWGIGLYLLVPEDAVSRVIATGKIAGYELYHLGWVEKGERKVIFEPEGIELSPPGT